MKIFLGGAVYDDDVKSIENFLQSCINRGYFLLDAENYHLLCGHLNLILGVLYKKYPQTGNNGIFLRSKYMALLLSDTLTAENENALNGYKNDFKSDFNVLIDLHNLSKFDDFKIALRQIKDLFGGRWSGITRENLFYYQKKMQEVENNPNRVNEIPDLRTNIEKAENLRKEVEEFVHKQVKLKI